MNSKHLVNKCIYLLLINERKDEEDQNQGDEKSSTIRMQTEQQTHQSNGLARGRDENELMMEGQMRAGRRKKETKQEFVQKEAVRAGNEEKKKTK